VSTAANSASPLQTMRQIVERLERLAILPFGTTQAEFVAIINRPKDSSRDAIKAARREGRLACASTRRHEPLGLLGVTNP
jgi:hypothetical protein